MALKQARVCSLGGRACALQAKGCLYISAYFQGVDALGRLGSVGAQQLPPSSVYVGMGREGRNISGEA